MDAGTIKKFIINPDTLFHHVMTDADLVIDQGASTGVIELVLINNLRQVCLHSSSSPLCDCQTRVVDSHMAAPNTKSTDGNYATFPSLCIFRSM